MGEILGAIVWDIGERREEVIGKESTEKEQKR